MSEERQKEVSFRDPFVLRALNDWHQDLDKNRGDRAALRRCRTPLEVAFLPAFYRLAAAMQACGRVDLDRLALVAGVLARVDPGDQGTDRFAQQLAADTGGRALVSDLRFRRLLAEDDPERLYGLMIRLVRHLDGHAEMASLAEGLYWWNQKTKKRWAQDYYDRAPAQKSEGEN